MDSTKNLISTIRLRPAVYIGKRSISCLKAFITGWYLRSPDEVGDSDVLDKFQEWIQRKHNIYSHSWNEIILFYSQDECDALDNFFKEFEIFLLEEEGDL
jgi:hypothetical protein